MKTDVATSLRVEYARNAVTTKKHVTRSFEEAPTQDGSEYAGFSSTLALIGGTLLFLIPLVYHLASLAGWVD